MHTYKVMALCSDESIFYTYYPEESKSFCGKMIREHMENDFVTTSRSSPKRSILKRQILTAQEMPQPQFPHPNILVYDLTKPPPNWRLDPPPQSSSFTPAPSSVFESQVVNMQPEQRTRRRRRHRKWPSEIVEALNEGTEGPEQENEDKDR